MNIRRTARWLLLPLGLLLCGCLDTFAADAELLFVEPVARQEGQAVRELTDIRVERVAGGRALSFVPALQTRNQRWKRVEATLQVSPAVREALRLRSLAQTLAPAPAQKWLSARGPLPVWVKARGVGTRGPGLVTVVPVRVAGRETESTHEAHQVLILEDLALPGGKLVTVEDLSEVGLLVPMVCHEICHGIMAEIYRERFLLLQILSPMPGGQHDSPVETDPYIAWKEGFAEAGELWLAKQFPNEFQPRLSPVGYAPHVLALAQRMHQRRVKLAERNFYIFAANGQVKDGQLKTGKTDLATEGVIASLLWRIWESAGFDDPLRATLTTLSRHAPATFFDFCSLLQKDHPTQRDVLKRILLEFTRYTLVSPEALKLYESYYLAKKAYVTKKISADDYRKARQTWEDWKTTQRQRIEKGAPLTEAVPQPLIVATRDGYTLDLNDEQVDRLAWHLEAFIPGDDAALKSRQAVRYAESIVEQRRSLGTFTSGTQLADCVPAWLVAKLAAGYRRSQAQVEKALDAELTARRTLRDFVE
ncbi:MAG TPA: hypothetical protein PKO06_09915 [Candidatus Ozemobacteraceae bacterium]|nr:hypothetical protein [Candidatus Ozemobacteraceae bacterium]